MHVIKGKRRGQGSDPARTTGRMQSQKLMDLIDKTAPDEGVVDVHALETSFANGSRRIALAEEDDGAVVAAVVEGGADTTRRMSAVEWDAAVSAAAVVEGPVHSESTMRMSAIQSSELARLIAPEVSLEVTHEVEHDVAPVVPEEPVVRFSTPRIVLPIPAPVNEDEDDLAIPVEAAPAIAAPAPAPARRFLNAWMIFAFLTLAAASAGLVLVALEKI